MSYAQAQAAAKTWFYQIDIEKNEDDRDIAFNNDNYTVADALNDYFAERERQSDKSAHKDKLMAKALIIPALGDIKVSRLNQRRIEKWLIETAESPRRLRSKKGAGQAYARPPLTDDEKRARKDSANRVLSILKAALNFAYKRRLTSVSDPCWQRVERFKRTSKARARFLTREEQVRLVNACLPGFRPLVRAALLTGCRYGELSRLKCQDYSPNPKNPYIFIAESKSGKSRHIYLTAEGGALFDELTAGKNPDAFVFTRGNIERRTRKSLCDRWGRDDQTPFMKAACEAAGLKITFHELRHTYASTLVNSGCSLFVVAHQLGHSSTKMVEKYYGHLSPGFIAEAVRVAMPDLGILE